MHSSIVELSDFGLTLHVRITQIDDYLLLSLELALKLDQDISLHLVTL